MKDWRGAHLSPAVHPRIAIERGKRGEKPCIWGMHIRVSDVLALLDKAVSVDDLLADYP